MSVSKDTLRHEAVRHRDRIDPTSGEENPDRARDLFFETIKPTQDNIVGLYWPKGREFDTSGIMERLLADGVTCALPVITDPKERVMRFARWDDSVPLALGPFKVHQPVIDDNTAFVTPDIVVVPMLAFDRRGYRLGYGGGHYDATLADLRAKVPGLEAVGVAYAQQAVLFNLPIEDHDQKLDWVITPQRVHCYKE